MTGTTVNCWFCNENSVVPPHAARDGWECPKCDQYNSFTPDGDVALPVSAISGLNNVRYNVAPQPAVEPVHQLCRSCNLNQMLKARQLASFRPIVEENWNIELEEYRAHLENIYGVCSRCQAVVARAIKEKDDMVRPSWLAWIKGLQKKMETATGSKRTEVGRSGLERLWVFARNAKSLISRCVEMVQWVMLVSFLLLLLNSLLCELGTGVLPAQYALIFKDVNSVYEENKGLIAFGCFSMWVVLLRPEFSMKYVFVLILWMYFCLVEELIGDLFSSNVGTVIETALIGGLVFFTVGNSTKRTLKMIGTKLSSNVTGRKSSSMPSTTKLTPNGPSNPLSLNGTVVNQATSLPSNGRSASIFETVSSLAMEKPTSLGSPAKRHPRLDSGAAAAGDTCSLLNLSLGSPRKSAGSRGVFTLQTYTPDQRCAQLFARPRRLLSPARLQTDAGAGGALSHSAWIAGGYWQRGQPALLEQHASDTLLSRSSSQSSGFVDAYAPNVVAAGSIVGDERPPMSPALGYGRYSPPTSEAYYRPSKVGGPLSAAGDLAPSSYVSSQYGDCRSCTSRSHYAGDSPKSQLDSSSQLSLHSSFAASQTGSILDGPATNRSVLVAMLFGFSVAFNLFAAMFLFKEKF